MHKQQANIDFSHVTQKDFSPLAHLIYSQLLANPLIFPNPTVSLAALLVLIQKWDDLIITAEYEGRTGDLLNARTAVEADLKLLGKFVNGLAKGDLSILQKSSFPISKDHGPVGDLDAPTSVAVSTGESSGTFDINIALVDNAWGYLLAYTLISNAEATPNNWTIRWMPKHTDTLTGFVTGSQYKFAACGVASSKVLHWTNSAKNLFAQ
jgi:hypothetical protein